MTAKELVKRLNKAGWVLDRVRGSHYSFKHPGKPGIITVPVHPGDLKKGLMNSLMKEAGLK